MYVVQKGQPEFILRPLHPTALTHMQTKLYCVCVHMHAHTTLSLNAVPMFLVPIPPSHPPHNTYSPVLAVLKYSINSQGGAGLGVL